MSHVRDIDTDYWNWYNHYLSSTNYYSETEHFIAQHAKTFKLDQAKTMVSIGSGYGHLDNFIISNCTPQLEKYFGVEPDKTSYDTLVETMNKHKGIKVTTANEGSPAWTGPGESVDVVLASHCFYHIEDRMGTLAQFYKWLKPGGTLIMLLCSYENVYSQIAQAAGYPLLMYTPKDLKQNMLQSGFQNPKEGKITVTLEQSYQSDAAVRLHFQTYVGEVPEEEYARLIKLFRERCDKEGVKVTDHDMCIKIEKPMS